MSNVKITSEPAPKHRLNSMPWETQGAIYAALLALVSDTLSEESFTVDSASDTPLVTVHTQGFVIKARADAVERTIHVLHLYRDGEEPVPPDWSDDDM